MKKLALTLTTLIATVACKSENPALTGEPTPPPPAIQRVATRDLGDRLETSFNPAVDILFVIDDSLSMEKHQKNLSNNIKLFVDELAKVKAIDFHIGYTLPHDRGRYGSWVPERCPGKDEPNWEPVGSLRPLKGPSDKLPTDGRRFVTNADDFTTILKATLDPAVNTSLVKTLVNTPNDPAKLGQCGYGPEEEEMFSPIIGLLEDPTREAGPNKGFRRKDAFLVVIIVSDAKSADVNFGLTPEVVMSRIAAATGSIRSDKKRFRVLSVAMKPGVMMNSTDCKPDPAFGEPMGNGQTDMSTAYGRRVREDENPLVTLAQLTQDEGSTVDPVLSICDQNYGDDLVKYGQQVKEDALSDIQIPLKGYPQVFTDAANMHRNLTVYIGTTKLADNMWKYSSQTGNNGQGGVVTVFGQRVDWDKHPGEKIRVEYVPVDVNSSTAVPLTGN